MICIFVYEGGHVVYDNRPWDNSLRSSLGYVEQEDVVFPALTGLTALFPALAALTFRKDFRPRVNLILG